MQFPGTLKDKLIFFNFPFLSTLEQVIELGHRKTTSQWNLESYVQVHEKIMVHKISRRPKPLTSSCFLAKKNASTVKQTNTQSKPYQRGKSDFQS